MKVVLDSNIIIADFRMGKPQFKILLESSKTDNIELYLPQVVVDEVMNKFVQRVTKAKDVINAEAKTLVKLGDTKLEIGLEDNLVEELTKEYDKHLKKIVKENKVIILPYPTTSHEKLARKAMLKLKPFNDNEKGYRDNLVWESIKTLLTSAEDELLACPEVIFVTDNISDFGAGGNGLHLSLIDELEEEGFHVDSVAIYSLPVFTETIAKFHLSMADSMEKMLKKDDSGLKRHIDKYLFDNFEGSTLNRYYGLAKYANSAPIIMGINDDYRIGTLAVRKLNSKEYVVEVQFELEVEIDYYIDNSDYYGADDLDVAVIDVDWNDHVVAVSDSVNLEMEMTVVISAQLECISIEIGKINGEYDHAYDES